MEGDGIRPKRVECIGYNVGVEEAMTLPKVLMPKVLVTNLDLNWLQTIGEGWASPLKGFMREGTLLEVLHFNSVLVVPSNLMGNGNIQTAQTNFETFNKFRPTDRVSMSMPITLSCTEYTKFAIESSKANAVALTTQMGKLAYGNWG